MPLTSLPRRRAPLMLVALAAGLVSCKTVPVNESDNRSRSGGPTEIRPTGPVRPPVVTQVNPGPSGPSPGAPNSKPVGLPVIVVPPVAAAPKPATPRCSGADRLGTIDVDGKGVTITSSAGARLTARDGDPICDGDAVSTDADSQASVELQEGYVQTDRSTDPRFLRQKGSGCVLVDDFKFGKMVASTRSGDRCLLLRSADVLLKAPVGAVHMERPRTAPPGQAVTTKVTPLRGASVQVLNPSLTSAQLAALNLGALQAAGVSEVTPRTEAVFRAGQRLQVQQLQITPNQLPPAAKWQQVSPKLDQKLKIAPGG